MSRFVAPTLIGVLRSLTSEKEVTIVIAAKRAALYLRQSKSSVLGIERQREMTTAMTAGRGLAVVAEYVDDDVSASKPRGENTAFGRMLADYAVGAFDVAVVTNLDRLLRRQRDLVTLIDERFPVVTVDGALDLTTAAGRMQAAVLTSFAQMEVERKGERQKRAAVQRAALGGWFAGVAPYGYTAKGIVLDDEAAIVKEVFASFLDGEPLARIARYLQASGVPTRGGGPWRSSTVRSMLTNHRYAGWSLYRETLIDPKTGKRTFAPPRQVGEAADGRVRGVWTPLVDDETFEKANAILAQPGRKTQRGTERKHLGSGLYRCACGKRVRAVSATQSGGKNYARYACSDGCFYRSGKMVDEYVCDYVEEVLALTDFSTLIANSSTRAQAVAEVSRIEQEINDAKSLAVGASGSRLEVLLDRLDELDATLAVANRRAAGISVSEVLNAPDPATAFAAGSLSQRRAAVGYLVDVTLHPQPRGRKGLDPSSVTITPRRQGPIGLAEEQAQANRLRSAPDRAI